QRLSFLLGFPVMASTAFHALPVHPGRVLAEHLQPVQAEIPTPRAWMLREDHAVGYESTRISRPALQDRQRRQIRLLDNFLAQRGVNFFRMRQQRAFDDIAPLPQPSNRRWVNFLERVNQLLPDFGWIAPKRRTNAIHRAENIHQERSRGSLRTLKQQGRALLAQDPLGNFSDFQLRIDFRPDTL